MRRIEKDEMSTSNGTAFEVVTLVGLRLFEAEPTALTRNLWMQRGILILLPQPARTGTTKVKNFF